MKKIKHKLLCLSLALCGISPTLFAQGAYYYYENEKVPLGIHPDKVSILVPKGGSMVNKMVAAQQSPYNYEYTIQDDRFEHMVVNLASSQATPNKIGAATPAMQSMGESAIMLPVYQTDQFKELVLTNYLYVRLKKEGDGHLLDSIAKVYGIEIVDTNEWMPLWHTLSMTPQCKGSSLDIANAIFETGLFASAFPDFSYDMMESASGDNLNWGLYNENYTNVDIDALEAWDIATGKGVNVAVVDEGINRNHPDLVANMHTLRHNETDADETNFFSHGTKCALIIGAAKNNQMMIGIAYNAKIMEAKVTGGNDNATSKKLANCINWAWQNGADVISCSWKAYKNSMLKEAIDNAIDKGRNGKGAIVVNAAGNTNGEATFPAGYRSEILVVSAINERGERWQQDASTGSSYGENINVCAPGYNITIYDANGSPYPATGTSFSCPYVAGVAALILERNPYLTGQEVRDIIEKTANKTACSNFNANSKTKVNGSWNEEYGYGLVNAAAAVKSACIDKTVSGQINTSQKVVGCSIKAQNVSVTGSATLTLEALEQVELQGPFEIANGATMEIKVSR